MPKRGQEPSGEVSPVGPEPTPPQAYLTIRRPRDHEGVITAECERGGVSEGLVQGCLRKAGPCQAAHPGESAAGIL